MRRIPQEVNAAGIEKAVLDKKVAALEKRLEQLSRDIEAEIVEGKITAEVSAKILTC